MTPHPNYVILHLPVAEVGDPGGGENRCLFLAEGNVRAEEAAHNGKWTLEAFRAIAAEVKHLTPSSVLQIDRILEEVGPFGRVTLVKKNGRIERTRASCW